MTKNSAVLLKYLIINIIAFAIPIGIFLLPRTAEASAVMGFIFPFFLIPSVIYFFASTISLNKKLDFNGKRSKLLKSIYWFALSLIIALSAEALFVVMGYIFSFAYESQLAKHFTGQIITKPFETFLFIWAAVVTITIIKSINKN